MHHSENVGQKKRPDILTGFPDTRMVFHTPGIYRYAVTVSMIAKSSCGGVKADTIFTGEVEIRVSSEPVTGRLNFQAYGQG